MARIKSKNEDNFAGVGHELLSGMVAGMLIDAFGARPIFNEDGRATPLVEIDVPDDLPFPVRTFRLSIEPPEHDFGPADFMDAIANHENDEVRRRATEAAMITDLYEIAERERSEPDA